ncbi:ABC-type phosphate/phosphonate transport system, substrate-binding protein [Rhizobiales bacterium GAS191]|nr:ABC-type phosphate/phosphonate transport system, substrate-binding protein [Rhizobiales bacterium GAS113]SED48284.1 ABC-type phosphate/phosphonate transport system, substrate-binding protein [Rhizobiales bacterium GAS191]
MIFANARMYSPAPGAAAAWRDLFRWLARSADVPLDLIEHAAPAPLAELWKRRDLGACFMGAWPLAKRAAQVIPLAAPVMSDAHAQGRAVYWTDFVVRFGADFKRLEDTFQHRIAYTTKDSHSGYNAVRHHLLGFLDSKDGKRKRFYSEVTGPVQTPRAAALAVLEGRVEVAPLDAYAHILLRRYEPNLALGLRVVERSEFAPMPPLVASAGLDQRRVARLTDALIGAAVDPEARPILARLELKSFAPVDLANYDLTLVWEKEAIERGYTEIA